MTSELGVRDGSNPSQLRSWLVGGSRLDLTVTVTGRCNFRCDYCYEDFTAPPMSADVQRRIERLLDRRAEGLDELLLRFFGGEPLLELSTMLALGSHASRLADTHGFRFLGAATTNGWALTAANASNLCEVGISSFQVSLDGPELAHDVTRRRRGGKRTYGRILTNLRSIASTDLPFSVVLRCHVSSENTQAWCEAPDDVLELAADARFKIAVQPIEALGGVAQDCSLPSSDQVRAVAKALGVRPPDPTGSICYAAVPTAWVIAPDGALSRCTVIGDERNVVGQLGADGTFELNTERLQPWFAGWSGDDRLLECPVRGLQPAQTSRVFISSRR